MRASIENSVMILFRANSPMACRSDEFLRCKLDHGRGDRFAVAFIHEDSGTRHDKFSDPPFGVETTGRPAAMASMRKTGIPSLSPSLAVTLGRTPENGNLLNEPAPARSHVRPSHAT